MCTIFGHKEHSFYRYIKNKKQSRTTRKTIKILTCTRCELSERKTIKKEVKNKKKQKESDMKEDSIDRIEDNRSKSRNITKSAKKSDSDDTGIILNSEKNKSKMWYRFLIECNNCEYSDKKLKTSRRTGDYCPICSSDIKVTRVNVNSD